MSSPQRPLGVADLVPHRGTMSWLDRVISVDAAHAVAEADIRARQEGRPIALGFLVGPRRYDVQRQSFKVGECLRIQADCELMAGNGLGMFRCQILVGDETAALA